MIAAGTVLSLLVLLCLALLAGAYAVWRRRRNGKQAVLMAVLAVVVAANVAIWLVPGENDKALVGAAPR